MNFVAALAPNEILDVILTNIDRNGDPLPDEALDDGPHVEILTGPSTIEENDTNPFTFSVVPPEEEQPEGTQSTGRYFGTDQGQEVSGTFTINHVPVRVAGFQPATSTRPRGDGQDPGTPVAARKGASSLGKPRSTR